MKKIDVFCSEEQTIEINGKLKKVKFINKVLSACRHINYNLTRDNLAEMSKIKIDNKFDNIEFFTKNNNIYALLNNEYVSDIEFADMCKILSQVKIDREVYLDDKLDPEEKQQEEVVDKQKLINGGIYKTESGSVFLYIGKCTVPYTQSNWYLDNIIGWYDRHCLIYLKPEDLLYENDEDIFTKDRDSTKFRSVRFNISKPGKCVFIKQIKDLNKKIDTIVEEARFNIKSTYIKANGGKDIYLAGSMLQAANINRSDSDKIDLSTVHDLS
jgi:hypothetical protein